VTQGKNEGKTWQGKGSAMARAICAVATACAPM
jgi:hypothetical protein